MNNISQGLNLLTNLIAASDTFQTVVGAADAAEAKESIYRWEARGHAYPRAIVCLADRNSKRVSGTSWTDEIVLAMYLQFPANAVEYASDYQEAAITFEESIEAIESEMKAAQIASPHLYPDIIEWQGPDVETPDPDTEQGQDVFSAFYALVVSGVG